MGGWNADPHHQPHRDGPLSGPAPIEPGSGHSREPLDHRPSGLENSRADLILMLGVLSLFLCGPLGIVAWLMANSDLRKMAEGRMLRDKIGRVKVGRTLGIIGTALFIVSVALLVHFLPARIGIPRDFLKPSPLPPDQIVFAGVWFGNQGSILRIKLDGSGDFRSGNTTVTGGRVLVDGESLSIGIMGIGKTWNIDRKPYLKDGKWKMELDGEIFTRKLGGHLVHARKTGRGS
ncbi:MAG: hypothetical protein P8182_00325 [Deltaproteobacteria bacterium]